MNEAKGQRGESGPRGVVINSFYDEFNGKSPGEIFEILFERKKNAEETLKKLEEHRMKTEDCLTATDVHIGEFIAMMERNGMAKREGLNVSITRIADGLICRLERRFDTTHATSPKIGYSVEKISVTC